MVLVGLSPPTRGSRGDLVGLRPAIGSIPAHAGKPTFPLRVVSHIGVYPRPRGEAVTMACRSASASGLSPPTRGSRIPFRVRVTG